MKQKSFTLPLLIFSVLNVLALLGVIGSTLPEPVIYACCVFSGLLLGSSWSLYLVYCILKSS